MNKLILSIIEKRMQMISKLTDKNILNHLDIIHTSSISIAYMEYLKLLTEEEVKKYSLRTRNIFEEPLQWIINISNEHNYNVREDSTEEYRKEIRLKILNELSYSKKYWFAARDRISRFNLFAEKCNTYNVKLLNNFKDEARYSITSFSGFAKLYEALH